jgi:hypothetical protein
VLQRKANVVVLDEHSIWLVAFAMEVIAVFTVVSQVSEGCVYDVLANNGSQSLEFSPIKFEIA